MNQKVDECCESTHTKKKKKKKKKSVVHTDR